MTHFEYVQYKLMTITYWIIIADINHVAENAEDLINGKLISYEQNDCPLTKITGEKTLNP